MHKPKVISLYIDTDILAYWKQVSTTSRYSVSEIIRYALDHLESQAKGNQEPSRAIQHILEAMKEISQNPPLT